MKRLQEVIENLVPRCSTGDTITNRGIYELVAELRAIDAELEKNRRFPEAFSVRMDEETIPFPFEPWRREAGITVGGEDVPAFGIRVESSKGSTTFIAVVYFCPGEAIWKTHVTMNGCVVHATEHGERSEAFRSATTAIERAWDLRAPLIRQLA